MNIVLIWAIIPAIITWLVFVSVYHRVRWERSPEGRNIMSLAMGIVVLLTGLLWAAIEPNRNPSTFIMTVALAGITLVGAWRTIQLRRAQARARKTREEIK